jgi:hypothetical protein
MMNAEIKGGSSSPLLDAKIWRRSRIFLASPAERPIHLFARDARHGGQAARYPII